MLDILAVGQTLTIAGSVCSCDRKQVVLQEGTHHWMVQRTSNTVIDGACAPSSTVTVQCKSPDAQRKEGPCPGGTSLTPSK